MNWAFIIPGNIIELFIMYNYWFSMLERRYSRTKSAIIFFSVHLLNLIRSWIMFNQVTLKASITTVVSLVLMQILFKDKCYKKIFVHTVYMLCVLFAECLAVVFAKYVYNYDMINLMEPSLPCYLWQGTAYLFIFIFNIIALLLLKNKKIDPDNKVTQYIFLYLSVQCLMAFVFTMFIFEYKITSTIMILLIAFVIIASALIGIMIYRTVKFATAKTLEAEYIKKEYEMKDKHFTEIKEQYIEYRRLRHDFYNHIRIIKELKDSEKLMEYTKEIEKKFDKMQQVSYCDNLTLDALLSLKRTEAIQLGIKISYEICSLDDIKISDFDLCTIVANMLDNAIAASDKADEKYINLQINKKIGRLIIIVKNSSPPVDAELKTTKEDAENHGMGINNIRNISAQYDGDCIFKYENFEFTGIVNIAN